jgi:hypothetical protein
MQHDFAIGEKIARHCPHLPVEMLAKAIDRELYETEAYRDRFDSEDGHIGLIVAAITAFHGYLQAGGSLELGQGWQLGQDCPAKQHPDNLTSSTVQRFASGHINQRGTVFCTLATVCTHDRGYGLFFVTLEALLASLATQQVTISQRAIRDCLRDMVRLKQLIVIDRDCYLWNMDPRPFAAKASREDV